MVVVSPVLLEKLDAVFDYLQNNSFNVDVEGKLSSPSGSASTVNELSSVQPNRQGFPTCALTPSFKRMSF